MKQENSKYTKHVALEGSNKAAPNATKAATTNLDDVIDVTIRLRRKKDISQALKEGRRLTHEEYENEFGTSEDDIAKVEDFAHHYELSTVSYDKGRRSIILRGKLASFQEAFQIYLSDYVSGSGATYRARTGHINIPVELSDIVEGVFGLDNRPQARPMFQVAAEDGLFVAHTAAPASFTPDQLAKIYGFPQKVNGSGQCIAIIELGGGYRTKDITTYFGSLGITAPSIKAVSIDKALNSPSTPNGADGEVMLDIEVAGAIAPGAKMVVYFAPNTDKGFLDAITTAIHDKQNKPSVISISWGSAEKNWTQQSLTSFNEAFKSAALLGVTICVATGDQGSSDGETDGKVHVDFPASSPYALACGGTRLVVGNNKVTSETVWNDASDSATGGGISDFFPVPDYQQKTQIPASLNAGFKGRGIPDVAGNASPETGYKVLIDGQQMVIGGTSAVAPLMAGLIALLNQQHGKTAGFINPVLYGTANVCRDITQGNNITTSTKKGFIANAGWDACTGLGVLSDLKF